MKYLITGIGNPGEQYAHSRHNIGFDILDALAGASNISFMDKRYGWVAELKFKSRYYYLLKPNTYVNLSGNAVAYYLKKLKIPDENLLVVTDDLALEFGKIRLRPKGGDAGHNGLSSIIQTLGTTEFARLRFGIGNDFPKGYQVDHVLGKWTEEEQKFLKERIDYACEAIKSFGTIGIIFTMNKFNS
ncbi:MAG: aminoacyl-tRNA hydrolase [Bacteroidales bacterium]|nr:aminoacyl-tRNA hydrolase [Bacteroidales bacterium]MCF8391989.1 aminoacyl-tRNA hydrolase [Bacteroidales bacterium]